MRCSVLKLSSFNAGRRALLKRTSALGMSAAVVSAAAPGLSGVAALMLPAGELTAAVSDSIRLRDLYEKDMSFSSLAQSLDGQRITVQGFMAPPLKADAAFFVLTKRPMATCPFCSTSAEWPDDILAVYTKRGLPNLPFNVGIEVNGVLDLGDAEDKGTGFFSRVRLNDSVVSRV